MKHSERVGSWVVKRLSSFCASSTYVKHLRRGSSVYVRMPGVLRGVLRSRIFHNIRISAPVLCHILRISPILSDSSSDLVSGCLMFKPDFPVITRGSHMGYLGALVLRGS